MKSGGVSKMLSCFWAFINICIDERKCWELLAQLAKCREDLAANTDTPLTRTALANVYLGSRLKTVELNKIIDMIIQKFLILSMRGIICATTTPYCSLYILPKYLAKEDYRHDYYIQIHREYAQKVGLKKKRKKEVYPSKRQQNDRER